MTPNRRVRPLCKFAVALAVAAGLAACASGTSGGGAPAANRTPSRPWTQDTLIQPDGLLPNGLRPLRYFYW